MRGARSTLIAAAIALALLGCTAQPPAQEARPITTEESQLLATARFRNFDAGARSITTALTDAGTPLALTGWVDYRTEVGYAVLDTQGQFYLLAWNASTIAAQPLTAEEAQAAASAPVPMPAIGEGFQEAAMNDTGALHPLLSILISLGNDRPDNPLLLQSGGALWLRTDTIGETAVNVFAGPTTGADSAAATVDPDASDTRYWVDDAGLLHRFEVRLGAEWVTVDFGPSDVSLTSPFTTE